MWRVLKSVLKALLGITLLLVLVVSIAWSFPGLWLNRSTLFPILRLVAGDISGTADRVEMKARGLSGKAVALTLRDLCWKRDANKICVESLELDGEFYLFKTELVKIVKFVATGGVVDWTVTESKKEKTAEETTDLVPSPPAILDRISVEFADIAAEDIKIALPSALIKGKARVIGELTEKARWKVTANATYQDRTKPDSPPYDAELNAQLQSPHALWRGPFDTNLSLKGNLPEKSRLSLALKGNVASKRVEISGDIGVAKGQKKIKSDVKVLITSNVLDARTTGNADDIVPHVPRLRWEECHARYTHQSDGVANLDLSCPLAFTGGFCEFEGGICEEVFKSTNATIGSKLVFKPDNNKEQTVSGSIDIKADSLFHRIKEGNASISVNIDGNIADFPKRMNFHTKADLKIASFQNVVRIMKQRPWSVPAPFNSMDGTIDLHVDAEGNLIQEGGKIPITISTNLASPQQALRTAGAGQLTLSKDAKGVMKSDLDFTLQLEDVKIALPRLSASRPPRAFPDARFTAKPPTEAEAKTPSNFTYRVKIESREKPVQVLTNLASVPVPLTVRLELKSDEAPHGLVRIASFPVELFRRKAKIEYLDLQLKSDARYNEIKGRVVVAYTDYTVFITMMGLASAPQIHFESEPPLPEDQVLAVLLFGKKPETLTADQASSVGNTRAAVQNNALNLASMYLLASTPVESIGYDPITGSFNAKIKLADGTSVTVGTDFSQVNQLGFRQRLGSNWAINTYVNDPFAVVNRTLTALLEWSIGY